jgi:hypothetical protein
MAWVLAVPQYWFPGAYAEDAALRAEVSALKFEVEQLRADRRASDYRERQQQLYARAVWALCFSLRQYATQDASDYTVQTMQYLAEACDDADVPKGEFSYPPK